MARQSISPEQWEHARATWEGDIKVSYTDLAASLGISKQAVAKKAKSDKWIKRMDLGKVVNRAHQQADRAAVADDLRLANFAPNRSGRAPEVDAPPLKKDGGEVEHVDAEEIDLSGMSLEQRAEQLAIAKRAEVITRHRTELMGARNLIYTAMKEANVDTAFVMGKRAKITAEAMTIIQAAERKAWGLDKSDEAPPVIVLERG